MVYGFEEATFAFAAGFFALLSPCGFPMLPAFISYYLDTHLSVGKALIGGAVVSSGLFAIFSAVGLAAATTLGFIVSYIPFFTLLAGILISLLGLLILAGVPLPVLSTQSRAPKRKGLIGLFLFGVLYGLSTISCSAPIFLAVLLYAMAGGVIGTVANFTAYALGMAVPLISITCIISVTTGTIQEKIVALTPLLQKITGVIFVAVGIYLIFYFVW